MKEWFFRGILAALFLVSCAKEISTPPSPITELRFDVGVEDVSFAETKAVKSSWTDGDMIYVFFGTVDAQKYATLTYNGGTKKWSGATGPNLTDVSEIGTSGTMYGVYFPFGDVAVLSDGAGGVTFKDADGEPVWAYYFCGEAPYTVENEGSIGTLKGDFSLKVPDDYVYFFINKDGDKYSGNKQYKLSAEGVAPVACTGFSTGFFAETSLDAGHTIPGYEYQDKGVAFSGKIDDSWASAQNHRFYLYGGGETLARTLYKTLVSHSTVRFDMTGESASSWKRTGFRGYEISKGVLMRNSNGTYTLTSGDDPFELYSYYGDDSSKNRVYFRWSFLKSDEELGNGSTIVRDHEKLPAGWLFPSAGNNGDWYKIVRNAPSRRIMIQNENGLEEEISSNDKCYAFVVVSKDSKQYYGVVLFRDGSFIPKECGIKFWGKGSSLNYITYDQLLALEDAGSLFLSSTGEWVVESWRYMAFDKNVEGCYMSSTYASNKWYLLKFDNYSSPGLSATTGSNGASYIPVKLVKAI